MDPETKQLLEETHALAKDNHKMLRSIKRGQWLSFFSSILVWIVVLVLPLYLYQQYLQPIITRFSATSGMSTTTATGLFGLPSFAEMQKLINSYKAGQ
jgi:hypothetical protein